METTSRTRKGGTNNPNDASWRHGSGVNRASQGRRSTPVNNQHCVLGHQLLRANVEVRVRQWTDTVDVVFADLFEEMRQHFVELVVTDLDAIRMPHGFHTQLFVGFLG